LTATPSGARCATLCRVAAHRALAAAALIGVLTGCLKIDMALDLNEDATVNGEIIFAVTDELVQLTGQSRDELIEQFQADVMRDAPRGVTQQPYRAQGLAGTRLILDDVALDDFAPADETLTITHEGNHYVVDGRFDLRAVADLEQLSTSQRDAFEGVAETAQVRLAMTFPGRVIDHNGQLDGRTVTWTPTGTEPVELHARAEDSQRHSFTGPAIAALLILSAVAVLALRRRRETLTAGEPDPTVLSNDQPAGPAYLR
jgi:hypothetical protein